MPTSTDRPLKKRKRVAAAVVEPSPPPSPTHSASADESATESEDADTDAAPQLSAMDLLRLHFESQFEPIEPTLPSAATVIDEGSDDDDDEWHGISDNDLDSDAESLIPTAAMVVEHSVSEHAARGNTEMTKSERKRFMNGKVTSTVDATAEKATAPDATEAVNLKHDLALQRLLQESHLLDADTTTFEATGKNRLKAIDSRVQALGGKALRGQKMSMSMRKGIDGKRASDEGKRRKEARENGIILETEKKDERKKRKRGPGSGGDGGIGGPSVGRFKGGVLTLSKSDVRSIEGPREKKGGKGGRGGKGGGRGRGKK